MEGAGRIKRVNWLEAEEQAFGLVPVAVIVTELSWISCAEGM
jgi:hypothetical protein